jgi:hypothetical protein
MKPDPPLVTRLQSLAAAVPRLAALGTEDEASVAATMLEIRTIEASDVR